MNSYYRSDIPAIKQTTNKTRDMPSLRTNDLPGAMPRQIIGYKNGNADNFIRDYLRNEKEQMKYNASSSKYSLRNPLFADYAPNLYATSDSLDRFKEEYDNDKEKSNGLEKNMANFFDATPPRTGQIVYTNKLFEEKQKIASQEDNVNKDGKIEISDERKFKSNVANYWGVTPSQLLIDKTFNIKKKKNSSSRSSSKCITPQKSSPSFVRNTSNFYALTPSIRSLPSPTKEGNDQKNNLNTPVSNKSNKFERNVAGYDEPNLIDNHFNSSSNMVSKDKNNKNENNSFYNQLNYSNYSNNNQINNYGSNIERNLAIDNSKIQNVNIQPNIGENKTTVVKDFNLYKRPEEKYQIYNPLSGKRQINYIPKYNMMVQIQNAKHNYDMNTELLKRRNY